MVNFGLNSASILGIFLAVAGASLYFVRSVRPELSRDHDIFFAAVGLLCGLILLFQGWRLDPILQFGQFLLTGSTIFFAVETIRLRASTTEQARRSSPIVDEERPVSRVYRAELDQLEGYESEELDDSRQLRGYVERPPSRRNPYEEPEPPISRSRSRRVPDPYGTAESSSKRRTRPSSKPVSRDPYRDPYNDAWSESPANSLTPRKPQNSPPSRRKSKTSKKRPTNPYGESPYNYYGNEPDNTVDDYVDYQPIDQSEQSDIELRKPSNPRDIEPKSRRNPESPSNFDY